MKTRPVLSAALLIALSSCEKREYPPEQVFNDQEVFRVKAQVGGEEIDLRAGANNYYCYSSCEQGFDGVNRLTGELRKFNCDPCPESFYLHVNDLAPRPASAGVPVDSILRPRLLEIMPPGGYVHRIRFTASFNMSLASLSWDFGDGTQSSAPSPLHEYNKPGKYKVCLNAKSASNCVNTVCNDLLVFNDGSVMYASVAALPVSDRKAKFSANVTGKAPFTYRWHLGDGATAYAATVEHEYRWPGAYPVKLIVTDATGNVTEAVYNYVTNSDPSSCAANFTVSRESAVLAFPGSVRVAWTDKSNVVFSSDNVVQPASSYFEILSATEFDRNEAGLPTKLVRARINLLLSDGSRSIMLKTEEAVLAVAYK